MRIAYFAFLLLLVPQLCWGWQGKVVRLEDGDSGIALVRGKDIKFRLYGVDAPEAEQDFGGRAKSYSSRLMLRKVVEMKTMDRDRYDREVVLVIVDGKCASEELVKAGLAWVYSQYCGDDRCDGWVRLQEQAKAKRIGLWAARNPLPPWEYRERQRPDGSSWGWGLVTRLLGDYHGNESSHIFHRMGCKYFDCEGCTVVFSNREEAIRKGFKPCQVCRP
jgi:endonuclease YncB( thermonuclease family)